MGTRYFDSEDFPEYSGFFEFRSLYGRLFAKPPKFNNRILNFGCGDAIAKECCNADFFVYEGMRRLLTRRNKVKLDWELDARKPLKCGDGEFEGIFCEHTLEHLKMRHVRALLKEFHRILRPGGLIRVTVPSLEKYIGYYIGQNQDEHFKQWGCRGEAIWSLHHNFGHQCCFDGEFLGILLTEAGFEQCQQKEFGQGADPRLLLDRAERSWETLYMEARKPIA